jgi:hypothetical protein
MSKSTRDQERGLHIVTLLVVFATTVSLTITNALRYLGDGSFSPFLAYADWAIVVLLFAYVGIMRGVLGEENPFES